MHAILIYTLVFLNPVTGAETRSHHSVEISTLEICAQTYAQLTVVEFPEGHFPFQDMECHEK